MSDQMPLPLDSARWAKIEATFHQALELPAKDRASFLERSCGSDHQLRRAVERFLAADTNPSALVDKSLENLALPLLTGPAEATDAPTLTEGARVGRYRVGEVIGTGGMGTVYRAERADGAYEREVALKLVRTGRLQEEARRRFGQERQILARLQHPNIATLLDGGVMEDGQPYLAMELIAGQPITAYAASNGLGTAERLRLALQVIDAVSYAHRNLVVHRDLKPSNVLVTQSGEAKLLDFGIARLLEEDAEEGATGTGFLLMTPEYAAPEQIRGEPVTTATDVYGLGAMLYELLSGRSPFGRVGQGWKELERVLKHDPTPLSRAEGLDAATRRALEGDLTTIIQKALQKDPGRRYESARALGDDLRRTLSGRPVSARPASLTYRLTKFVRRNQVACALSATAALALVMGVAGTAWQARQAQMEAQRAQAVGDFLFSLFEGADPDLNPGDPVTAFELLEAGLARVDSLDAGVDVRVDLLTTMGILFGKLGHIDRAEELLQRAVAEADAAHDLGALARGKALDALGTRLALTGNLEDAVTTLTRALEIRRSARAPPLDIATTRGNLARAVYKSGQIDEAVEHYLGAIAALDDATGGDSLVFASELMGLAQSYEHSQRFEEADRLMRTVKRLREEGEGETPALATTLHNLGVLTAAWKDDVDGAVSLHREALAMWRRIFPGGHPEVSTSLEQVARLIELQGEWEEADSLYAEALGLWSNLYGDTHPYLATLRANQANLHYRQGNMEGAADAYKDIVRIYRAQGDAKLTSVSIANLGVIERTRGDYRSADTLLAESLAIRRGYLEEPNADIAQSISSRAALFNLQGRYQEAQAAAREAIEQYESVLPLDHSLILWPRVELGVALTGLGRTAEAIPILAAAHARMVDTLNPADGGLGRASLWLGVALAREGEVSRAQTLIEAAHSTLEAALPPGAPDRVLAAQELERLGN